MKDPRIIIPIFFLLVGLLLSLRFFMTPASLFQKSGKMERKHKRVIIFGIFGLLLCFVSGALFISNYIKEQVNTFEEVDYTKQIPEISLKYNESQKNKP